MMFAPPGTVMFAESAGRLAGMAGVAFGWLPETFWNATPAELAALVAALRGDEPGPLDQDVLARFGPLGAWAHRQAAGHDPPGGVQRRALRRRRQE